MLARASSLKGSTDKQPLKTEKSVHFDDKPAEKPVEKPVEKVEKVEKPVEKSSKPAAGNSDFLSDFQKKKASVGKQPATTTVVTNASLLAKNSLFDSDDEGDELFKK